MPNFGAINLNAMNDLQLHMRIKMLRIKRGLLQREVAEGIFMAQNTYSDLETGKREITMTALQKIAAFYSLSIPSILEIPIPPTKNK